MGRKTKLTPEVQEKFVEHISSGLTFRDSCLLEGIEERTFHVWKARGEKEQSGVYHHFHHAIKKAQAEDKRTRIEAIKKAGTVGNEYVEEHYSGDATVDEDGNLAPISGSLQFRRITKKQFPVWQANFAWLQTRYPDEFPRIHVTEQRDKKPKADELEERREQFRQAHLWDETRRDPESYWRTILNHNIGVQDVLEGKHRNANAPWQLQSEIMAALRDHRRVVVRSGNNLGKTHLAAVAANWFTDMGPGLVLLLGAKFQQVKNVLFAQFSSIRRELDPEASIQLANFYQDREKYPSWAVHALTTANPEGIAGYHPERVLVIVDEASSLDNEIYESIEGILSGSESYLLLIGNPIWSDGIFRDAFDDVRFKSFVVSGLDHPNVIHQKSIYKRAISPGFPAEIAKAYGEDSDVFRIRVLGEFPTSSGMTVIVQSWLEGIYAGEKNPLTGTVNVIPEDEEKGRDSIRVIGVDLAGGGSDFNVAYLWEESKTGAHARLLLEINTVDHIEVADPVADAFRTFNCDLVVFDAVGVGTSFGSFLEERNIPPTHIAAFKGGSNASNEKRFFNRNAEIAFSLRRRIEVNQRYNEGIPIQGNQMGPENALILPDVPNLKRDLEKRRYQLAENNRIRLEPKDKLDTSPDHFDAIMMAQSHVRRVARMKTDDGFAQRGFGK